MLQKGHSFLTKDFPRVILTPELLVKIYTLMSRRKCFNKNRVINADFNRIKKILNHTEYFLMRKMFPKQIAKGF